jgi:hypothetical protein
VCSATSLAVEETITSTPSTVDGVIRWKRHKPKNRCAAVSMTIRNATSPTIKPTITSTPSTVDGKMCSEDRGISTLGVSNIL